MTVLLLQKISSALNSKDHSVGFSQETRNKHYKKGKGQPGQTEDITWAQNEHLLSERMNH